MRKKEKPKPTPQYVHPKHQGKNGKKKMSFDLHGVLDANSDFFRMVLQDLIRQGWEIHIVTGGRWAQERSTLKKLRIPYTHFFSIVDYHVTIGTKIKWDEKGNAHIDPYVWDRTKGLYCREHGIIMHFDDSDSYGYFFKTPYVRYFSKDSSRDKKVHI